MAVRWALSAWVARGSSVRLTDRGILAAMRQTLLVVVLFAACGGPRSTAPGGGTAGGGDGSGSATTGGEGAICAVGAQNQDPNAQAVACAEGLECCYPCGIEGCDSVCMKDCGPPRP
jgi:hypothetical protein